VERLGCDSCFAVRKLIVSSNHTTLHCAFLSPSDLSQVRPHSPTQRFLHVACISPLDRWWSRAQRPHPSVSKSFPPAARIRKIFQHVHDFLPMLTCQREHFLEEESVESSIHPVSYFVSLADNGTCLVIKEGLDASTWRSQTKHVLIISTILARCGWWNVIGGSDDGLISTASIDEGMPVCASLARMIALISGR
jgi:hypothetical protein